MKKSLVESALDDLIKADQIPGGLADKKKPSDFDEEALEDGIKVEMEHTSSRSIATEIAMDHLTEDKEYYEKLEEIEDEDEDEDEDEEKSVDSALDDLIKGGKGGGHKYIRRYKKGKDWAYVYHSDKKRESHSPRPPEPQRTNEQVESGFKEAFSLPEDFEPYHPPREAVGFGGTTAEVRISNKRGSILIDKFSPMKDEESTDHFDQEDFDGGVYEHQDKLSDFNHALDVAGYEDNAEFVLDEEGFFEIQFDIVKLTKKSMGEETMGKDIFQQMGVVVGERESIVYEAPMSITKGETFDTTIGRQGLPGNARDAITNGLMKGTFESTASARPPKVEVNAVLSDPMNEPYQPPKDTHAESWHADNDPQVQEWIEHAEVLDVHEFGEHEKVARVVDKRHREHAKATGMKSLDDLCDLVKAKYIRKIGTGKTARYVYKEAAPKSKKQPAEDRGTTISWPGKNPLSGQAGALTDELQGLNNTSVWLAKDGHVYVDSLKGNQINVVANKHGYALEKLKTATKEELYASSGMGHEGSEPKDTYGGRKRMGNMWRFKPYDEDSKKSMSAGELFLKSFDPPPRPGSIKKLASGH